MDRGGYLYRPHPQHFSYIVTFKNIQICFFVTLKEIEHVNKE